MAVENHLRQGVGEAEEPPEALVRHLHHNTYLFPDSKDCWDRNREDHHHLPSRFSTIPYRSPLINYETEPGPSLQAPSPRAPQELK